MIKCAHMPWEDDRFAVRRSSSMDANAYCHDLIGLRVIPCIVVAIAPYWEGTTVLDKDY